MGAVRNWLQLLDGDFFKQGIFSLVRLERSAWIARVITLTNKAVIKVICVEFLKNEPKMLNLLPVFRSFRGITAVGKVILSMIEMSSGLDNTLCVIKNIFHMGFFLVSCGYRPYYMYLHCTVYIINECNNILLIVCLTL